MTNFFMQTNACYPMSNKELIEKLNGGLAWELRAAALYSHYSAYVKGIHRLNLKPFFDEEASESNKFCNSSVFVIIFIKNLSK